MPSSNSFHLSPPIGGASPISPSLSISTEYSAVSPRVGPTSSIPTSPVTNSSTPPSLSGHSNSIRRKPVPVYDGTDQAQLQGDILQHKAIHVIAVDQPLEEQEVLKSPVRVSFENELDRISSTPSISAFKNTHHLGRSLSGRSSKSLPVSQIRVSPPPQLQAPSMSLQSNVAPINGKGHLDRQLGGHEMRRESHASFASSLSGDNSESNQSSPLPSAAAQHVVLGRSLYNMNGAEANNMSTDQLFTIVPNHVPNARIRQLRDARSQVGLAGESPGMQAPAMVRIPTDKSIDRQMATGEIEAKSGNEGRSSRVPSAGLTGLGIRGADLTPEAPPSVAEYEAPRNETMYSKHDFNGPDIISSRLNRSLPALPLNRTQSNLDKTSAAPNKKGKTSKKSKVMEEEFSEHAVPTPMRLWEASQCYLVDELGRKRRFGDFWDTYSAPKAINGSSDGASGKHESRGIKSIARNLAGPSHQHPHHHQSPEQSAKSARAGSVNEKNVASLRNGKPSADEARIGGEEYIINGRKTVVFWIRHFWCGQCQDYTLASLGLLDAEAIHKAGLNVIVISNGSWKIIKRYRELFRCPFPIYVDASRRLYRLMGMTKLSNDFGPSKGRAAYHQHAVPRQVVTAIGNGLFKMPLANPGTFTQLGGEFIIGPGLKCDFAHRMTNTSNHMEAYDVLNVAGVESSLATEIRQGKVAEEEVREMARLQHEEAEWRESRAVELDNIKRRKEARRGLADATAGVGERDGDDAIEMDAVAMDAALGDGEGEEEEGEMTDPEERRRQFDEYRQRTGLTVNQDEDFDGFVLRSLEEPGVSRGLEGLGRKRLSTPMEYEEEEQTRAGG